MTKRICTVILFCVASLVPMAGCSGSGAAWSSVRVGGNLLKKDSRLKVWVDGHQAKQNVFKKGAMGYAEFKVRDKVSTTPTLKFEFEDPEHFGRIKGVFLSIYQEYKADYSGSPEYKIIARSNEVQDHMKPGVVYTLADPGEDFKVLDYYDKEVKGVDLIPGMEYMLLLTITGDRNETAHIYFNTK